MNRRPFNMAALASFVLFILSAGTLLANICWGHWYGYVGRRPQYVIAMDELSLIVQRQDGTFTVKVPLLVSTVLFGLLPAVWYDRRRRRRFERGAFGYDAGATPAQRSELWSGMEDD